MNLTMMVNSLVVPSILVILLDKRCIIQAYSPVIILELIFGGFFQPALWWLCIDGGKSHVVKWTVLAIGIFMPLVMPQILDPIAEDIDGNNTPVWMLILTSADEKRVFGQGNHTWPLMERVEEVARENFGAILDLLGFSKGNFDGGLDSVMDNFRLTEEFSVRDLNVENVEKVEEGKQEAENHLPFKYGRELPFIYANLVKNFATILTFGVASPFTTWVGCFGILFRWLALNFLAERFENKRKERGEGEIKTDAQGMPFRCIILVVICSVYFVGSSVSWHWTHLLEHPEEGESTAWTPIILITIVVALTTQINDLGVKGSWRNLIGRASEVPELGGGRGSVVGVTTPKCTSKINGSNTFHESEGAKKEGEMEKRKNPVRDLKRFESFKNPSAGMKKGSSKSRKKIEDEDGGEEGVEMNNL
ncbi:hypothetical protein TrLO_g3832 [Triparma laevis f. longispina]|uniref:Uncharacterized protein n=1 Tax=Triparma laevis f. longispina TaxID=1714387 RepID=A0A9W7CAG6_9STRA|nr:hypothetical protein TrLO_g3832 [Triparma laevis f. longispina]